MLTIVPRGLGDKIVARLRIAGIRFHLVQLGEGTASSDLLHVMGLDSTEKDVVISIVRDYRVSEAFGVLNREFHFDRPGTGIAFTIPISSVSGLRTLQIISGLHEKRNEGRAHG